MFNININIPFLFNSKSTDVTNADYSNLNKNKLFDNHLNNMNNYENFLKGEIDNEVLFRNYKKIL